jgi:hypothetical protein
MPRTNAGFRVVSRDHLFETLPRLFVQHLTRSQHVSCRLKYSTRMPGGRNGLGRAGQTMCGVAGAVTNRSPVREALSFIGTM